MRKEQSSRTHGERRCAPINTTRWPTFRDVSAVRSSGAWYTYLSRVYGPRFLEALQPSDLPWHTTAATLFRSVELERSGLGHIAANATTTCEARCEGAPNIVRLWPMQGRGWEY
jgi:hypothetical protein